MAKKTICKWGLLCSLLVPPLTGMAQSTQSSVQGIVSDPNGEPIIGATIKVNGSKVGAVTDLDGKFNIDAAPGTTLTITYVGMVPKTVKVEGGQATIHYS